MVRRGQNLRGPYGYVITQVYRKVPITINPAHRSRASQHPWLPERSTKLAVGASGGVLPPHSHYKQGQYSRFLRPVVAYGDGYSSPPIPGDCLYLHMETHPLRNNFTAGTRGSFLALLASLQVEYPDPPQPPKCLPVTAVDRHQGNMTTSDQKAVYRAHRGP